MIDLTSSYRWLDDDGPAFGAPGMEPRWTSSEKDAVATAYAASSRVWFTVSHGTLNEIYYPTIDRPQTRDMELLFSDGETFFHEEKRNFEYDFHYIDEAAPAVRVVASDLDGRYTVTKEFISDPHHPVVLMHVKITGDADILSRLKCYALLAPHLNGGGAGNSARSIDVAGQRCLLAWKGETSLAFGASCGFIRSSCGYAGTSDGYQNLAQDMRMTWQFGQALDGNLAIMGEVDIAKNPEFTIAISFGDGHHSAIAQMMQTLAASYDDLQERFLDQWRRVNSPARLAAASTDGGKLMRISHNVLLTHEDKTFSGAFIASASVPWGASKGDSDLGGYHLVWTRDMVQTASALLACGRTDTALRALVYLACTQKPDGSFAQNFWIDGTPYWTGIQLDEVAFPIILAWRLWKQDGLGNFDVFPFVERAASFLVRYAPVTQQERWEEAAGYSPSTLAAVISGLICAADIARDRESVELADYLETYADWIESHLDEWTTTTEGVLHPDVKYHYMRIRPPAQGEPFHDDSLPPGMIRINNREPGEKYEFEAREVIDGGFLELVRYGIRRPDDPLIVDSLKVVDHVLKIETPYGVSWRRYNHDGYGQKKDGGPYDGSGQGRAWPILTGERGHYELCAESDFTKYIKAIEQFSSVGGMLPEQVWDYDDIPSKGMYRGRSAGSAQPLVWAHAEYLKLLRSAADGRVFDRIQVVEERYAVPKGKRSFSNHIEIFEPTRPISSILSGHTLRIVDREHFHVVYTYDNWATTLKLDSRSVGYSGSFVDIPTGKDQVGKITFTLAWPVEGQKDRWLGRNIDVAIHTVPASTKV
ncbi:glycoside hydrolase family 15 protein [Tunturiibacter lichenicola]|uniref:glycoside hydrolase family 15 protein n=1 Tax=Tunturiibacter lichenicola TaxID=2051959 RepID=UPI0021B23B21|nr:glycoside hydrolase family 15 protein [Edaphobacter lichenicola]